MYCDGLLNLAHVVIGITITAPMQACIIKANVSALLLEFISQKIGIPIKQ